MPSNQAAWLTAKSATPLQVKKAQYTAPGENELVVKNAAVAVNPLDWVKQDTGDLIFGWIKYPFVLGSDLAGQVVEVGKGVTRFKVGDRVLGNAVGMDHRSNKSSEAAFQEYTVLRTSMTSPIPDSLSYEEACVLPLGLSTAASGMFMKDFLALPYPKVSPRPNGKTLLVWGGSTSVGSNAIQLGVASGHDVIATASPKNFDYVRRLGAAHVFDYNSPTVVKDLIEAFRDRESAGALAIGNDSLKPCIDVLGASRGKKFVAQATVNAPGGFPTSALGFVSFGMFMGWDLATTAIKSRTKRVDKKFIFGTDLMANEVCRAIYEDFLPGALAHGKFIAAPPPHVVGKGLEHVQEAIILNKKGVSAKKVVVSL